MLTEKEKNSVNSTVDWYIRSGSNTHWFSISHYIRTNYTKRNTYEHRKGLMKVLTTYAEQQYKRKKVLS
jgi:hypothetical protein